PGAGSPAKYCFVDLVHLREVFSAQLETVTLDELVLDCLKILREQPVIGRCTSKCLKDRSHRRFLSEASRRLSREEFGHEVGTVHRHLKDGFVHQVFEQVLPADVEYECHFRLRGRDICKVLLRPYSKVRATWLRGFFQTGNHVLKLAFVGHVLEAEVSAFLRKVRDHLPEGIICERARKTIDSPESRRSHKDQT